jgi:uncharacterized protein (TIGR02597 family)
MKHNLSLLTGALLFAVAAGASAQTAVTDPVGYITANVTGTNNPASPAISYVGASLVNKVEYAGTATAGADNSATFAAGSFADGAFGLNSLSEPRYYVEITTGANAGVWTDIASNTTSSLTLADPIGAMMSGQNVKIRAHHTVASLFGDNAGNALKLSGGVDTASADILELISPVGVTQLFFNTDENAWVSGANLVNDKVIAPGEGIKVRRRGADVPIVWVGHVKTGPTVLPVETGTNLVAIPRAVGSNFTLANSGLMSSGLLGGVDTASADILTQLSGFAVSQIYYNTDEAAFVSGANIVDTTPLPEGSALRIQRRGAPFNWVVPQETIAP